MENMDPGQQGGQDRPDGVGGGGGMEPGMENMDPGQQGGRTARMEQEEEAWSPAWRTWTPAKIPACKVWREWKEGRRTCIP